MEGDEASNAAGINVSWIISVVHYGFYESYICFLQDKNLLEC